MTFPASSFFAEQFPVPARDSNVLYHSTAQKINSLRRSFKIAPIAASLSENVIGTS
jgi:hypothetical protein